MHNIKSDDIEGYTLNYDGLFRIHSI